MGSEGKKIERDRRAALRAAALRENLKRRKTQNAERSKSEEESDAHDGKNENQQD